jgi:hypothetical protein
MNADNRKIAGVNSHNSALMTGPYYARVAAFYRDGAERVETFVGRKLQDLWAAKSVEHQRTTQSVP